VVRDPSINAFALPRRLRRSKCGPYHHDVERKRTGSRPCRTRFPMSPRQHLVRAVEAEQKYAPLMILAMVGAIAASAHQSPYSTQQFRDRRHRRRGRSGGANADQLHPPQTNPKPIALASRLWRKPISTRMRWRNFSAANGSARCGPGFDETDVPALLNGTTSVTTGTQSVRSQGARGNSEERGKTAASHAGLPTTAASPAPYLRCCWSGRR